MMHLIKKDFVIQRNNLLLYFIVGCAFLLFFHSMGDASLFAVIMPIFLLSYGFMNRSVYDDEKNESLRLIVSLPISRAAVVRSKYASIGIVAILTVLVYLGLGIVLGVLPLENRSDLMDLPLMLGAFMIALSLVLSLFLFLAFRLGFMKASSYYRFSFLAFFAIGLVAGSLPDSMEGAPDWLVSVQQYYVSLPTGITLFVMLLAALALYVVSMLVSARSFERRNLF